MKNCKASPNQLWQEDLKERGYLAPEKLSLKDKTKIKLFGLTLFYIIMHVKWFSLKKRRIFEFGCGNGAKLMPFFYHGATCCGIDISADVIERAEQFSLLVEKNMHPKGKINFICRDFLKYNTADKFDLVFHSGVLEHFLDEEERRLYLHKMFSLAGDNSYVASIVPNGQHPYRQKQRDEQLGGYNIPEIDYSMQSLFEEMQIEGEKTVVLPLNVFGYYCCLKPGSLKRRILRILNKVFKFIPPAIIPSGFAGKYAYWLIAISKIQ